jgi:hypothetical protein
LWEDEEARSYNTGQSTGKESYQSLRSEHGGSQGIITIFPLDQGRRDMIVQAQQPRSCDIRGRFIRRPDQQLWKITKQSDDHPRRSPDKLVDSETGRRVSLDHRSRVFRRLRENGGRRSHETTDIRNADSYKNPCTNDRLGRSIESVENFKIPAAIKTHRTPVPLLEERVQQRPFNYPPYPSEEESFGHPHQDHTYVNDTRVEKELDEWNKWELQWQEWINEEMLEQGGL